MYEDLKVGQIVNAIFEDGHKQRVKVIHYQVLADDRADVVVEAIPREVGNDITIFDTIDDKIIRFESVNNKKENLTKFV